MSSFRGKTENITKYIFGGFLYYNMSGISILFSKTYLLLYFILFYLYVFLYLLTIQVLGYLVSLPVYCFCVISEYGNELISSSLSVSCAFSLTISFVCFVKFQYVSFLQFLSFFRNACFLMRNRKGMNVDGMKKVGRNGEE